MRMENTEEEPQTKTKTKRITIPFERYEQIAKSILRYMTRTEEAESNGEFYSDDDRSSLSKSASQQQTSPTPNNQLVPYRSSTQPIFNTSKLVLFIQMQLCDTTLYDWLRYRDQSIIEQTSDERRISFYMLDDFRQKECRNIFEQILQAVDVRKRDDLFAI